MNILAIQHLFFEIDLWSVLRVVFVIACFFLGFHLSKMRSKSICMKIDAILIAILFLFLIVKYLFLNYFITPNGLFDNFLILMIVGLISMIFGTAHSQWRQKKSNKESAS